MPRYFKLFFMLLIDYKQKKNIFRVIHEHEIYFGIQVIYATILLRCRFSVLVKKTDRYQQSDT